MTFIAEAQVARVPDTSPLMLEPGRQRLVAIIVACALFMQNLDGTVVATALPAMARAFGADPVHMNVALTAYLFAIAVFIPASGWMADRFGTRDVFRAAVAVFTLGSVLCGFADSLGGLVAARIVQGAGGAMMLPVGRLVLLRAVPKDQLIAAMAWVTIPALVGPVIGPPIGGLLVTYASWNWIFFVNLPIGVVGFLMIGRFIGDTRETDPGPLDWAGMVLSGLTLASFMAVLELAGRNIVPMAAVVAIGVACLAAGVGYAVHARGRSRKLLDFSLLRVPTFAVSVGAGSLFRVGIGAVPFLLPMMLQVGFGRSPVQSGLITFASALGAIGMKPATQWVLRRFGFRSTLVVNGAACATTLALYAAFTPSWPLAALYAVLVAGGLMRSLQFTAFNAIAYADVPPHRMSSATTLYAALQQISLTVGIPIGALVLHIARQGQANPGASAFSLAFLVVAGISALAAPAALLLPRGAGREMSGQSVRDP